MVLVADGSAAVPMSQSQQQQTPSEDPAVAIERFVGLDGEGVDGVLRASGILSFVETIEM